MDAPNQRYISRFIYYAALGIPRIDIERWRLSIVGEVERPLEFTYSELISMINVKYVRDFHCVTGWSVRDVEWEGVRIRDLASMVGVRNDAKWVVFRSADGYESVVPAEDALSEDAIIALRMNGKPLDLKSGYPARPFIPHLYGWKSAKWLTTIEFTKQYRDGYWEAMGYHERGNVHLEERFKGMEGTHTGKTRRVIA
jgi:DMSO/TMAO reductase YedYZ molybdopterin-dependent catalytic subunit